MKNNLKDWKTTLMGIAAFAVGLWQFIEKDSGHSLSIFLVVLGAGLMLSPDKIIDAFLDWIRNRKNDVE